MVPTQLDGLYTLCTVFVTEEIILLLKLSSHCDLADQIELKHSSGLLFTHRTPIIQASFCFQFQLFCFSCLSLKTSFRTFSLTAVRKREVQFTCLSICYTFLATIHLPTQFDAEFYCTAAMKSVFTRSLVLWMILRARGCILWLERNPGMAVADVQEMCQAIPLA